MLPGLKWFIILTLATAALARRSASRDNAPGNVNKTSKFIDDSKRQGKLFSLFSIVSFENENCISSSSIKGGSTPFRNGTCFTSSECADKKGTPAGGCAAGFGVCCLFTTSKCGTAVAQNNTYARNPGFPRDLEEADDCSYPVQRVSDDICTLRLDFERFVMAGPSDTDELSGGLCTDTFNVDGVNSGVIIPQLCGTNTGQHMYIDIGPGNAGSNAATLTFEFAAGSDPDDVEWEIKIAQIECGNKMGAPSGCLQYYTGTSGRIKTFNFDGDVQQHLRNHRYSNCIRQEAGFCCVQYTVCPDEEYSFTIDATTVLASYPMSSLQEEKCYDLTRATVVPMVFKDYIRIEGGSNQCTSLAMVHKNKYCGDFLSTLDIAAAAKDHEPICDCSAPFAVDIYTNEYPDALTMNDRPSRGVCLDWKQIPC